MYTHIHVCIYRFKYKYIYIAAVQEYIPNIHHRTFFPQTNLFVVCWTSEVPAYFGVWGILVTDWLPAERASRSTYLANGSTASTFWDYISSRENKEQILSNF